MARDAQIARRPLLALAAILSLLMIAPSAQAAVQAREADGVVESIGVNTHLGYTDTPYNSFSTVRQRLQELGIRYIRDGVSQNRPDVYSRLRTLAGDGIHLDVIAGDPLQRWNIGTIDQRLDLIQKELGSSVVSIEGPTSTTCRATATGSPPSAPTPRSSGKGSRRGRSWPGCQVLCPSIVTQENMAAAGDLSQWCDYGNTHTYLSGAMPESSSIWRSELGAAARNSGSKPVQVTETGYHNGTSGTVGHQPCSEKATGIYMPRLFLENFNRGNTVRSFSYELLDQRNDASKTDIEAAFGLLRNDSSKKPAAVAIERLIGLLSDRGAGFTPASLAYSLEGAPASAQQMLLQKRDGSFYLVLWNKVSVWNQSSRTDLDPADAAVTLKLGQPIASAEVFEPNVAAGAVASTANPTSLKLNLSERVQVIKLVPAAPPAPARSPKRSRPPSRHRDRPPRPRRLRLLSPKPPRRPAQPRPPRRPLPSPSPEAPATADEGEAAPVPTPSAPAASGSAPAPSRGGTSAHGHRRPSRHASAGRPRRLG